ncbi:MAG: ATPase, T2SS/T4P/T4SS family [Thermoguttaceae bacterium]|jgi:type II secretory ATPase GspE/PulE/Tfp pilus assembly ATPase PilB-like protein
MKILRPIIIPLLAVVVLACSADWLWAGVVEETAYLRGGSWRGPGNYLSWIKILACWLTFIAWIRSTSWVNRDVQEVRLDWRIWNPIVVGSFLVAMLLVWVLPWFWLDLPLLVAAYVGPLATYIVLRNRRVSSELRVLTPAHLRYWFATCLKGVGVKVAAEKGDPNVSGVPVNVFSRFADDPMLNAAKLLAARQSGGLPAARKILCDGLSARASAILLDYVSTAVVVRYLIDGVWLPQKTLERESADPAMQALKLLCGLNPQDRRGRQEGKFGVEYSVFRGEVLAKIDRAEEAFRQQRAAELTRKLADDRLSRAKLEKQVVDAVEKEAREKFATPVGIWTPIDQERLPKLPGIDQPTNLFAALEPLKCPATLATQGTPNGERVVVRFEVKTARLTTLDDLGMRAKMQEQFKQLLDRPKGFVLLSAPPGGGLRTTMRVTLQSIDRFMRECITVEDEAQRCEEVENVALTTYQGAAQQTPATVLPTVFRLEPQVVVVRELVDSQTVRAICAEVAAKQRLVIGGARARDCAEALARVMKIDAPVPELAKQISAVLCQRLLRRLCDKCKVAYSPSTELLSQWGIPEGRVRTVFRPRQPKPTDEGPQDVCRECGGSGYKGQAAIFELLVMDESLRKLLAQMPKLEVFRAAARKAGMKTLQEEGVLLVARGITSLPELVRVLKG